MKKLLFCTLALLLCGSEIFAAASLDIYQYRSVGPSRGGRVTAVAGTQAAPATFYMGASGGGLWKSDDSGITWNNVSDGYFATPSIGAIAVDQKDPNIVYVGTGSDGIRSNVIPGKGVYKSLDAGATWQHLGLELTGQIGGVEIDPRNNNTVYVAALGNAFAPNAERGLYKTSDGGKTWNKVLFVSNQTGIADLELNPSNPEIIYAAAWKFERKPWTIQSGGTLDEGGIYKSIDGGASWSKINKGLPTGLIGKIDLAVSRQNSSVLYALVEAPNKQGGLYKSTDQGENFVQVSDHEGIRNRPFYYTNISADPNNAEIVYSLAGGFFKSVDGGKNWMPVSAPHADSHDMWINPDNSDLWVQSNDGGANVTHNGGKSWSSQMNQPTAEIYQVWTDDQYPYWLYGGQQDNGTAVAVASFAHRPVQDKSAYLESVGGCETGPAVPKPGNHNIIYTACKGTFTVFDKRTGTERSYFVGATNMYSHHTKDMKHRFQRVTPIIVSPHNAGVVYHASQYVHKTTDEGITWQTISPDLTANEPDKQNESGTPITRDITGEETYSTLYAVQESPIKEGVIWTGSNDGVISVTQDGGGSWANVTPKAVPKGGRVNTVEPSPHNIAKAYTSILRYQLGDPKPYILKTTDSGKSWALLTNGNGIPADFPVRVVREDPVREGLLYAGTDSGVFISFDDGKKWQVFQQNLPLTVVTDIKVFRDDLALSTMGRGFYVMDDVNSLRQFNPNQLADSAQFFTPRKTIRVRHPANEFNGAGVPNFPTPSVNFDYYLPSGASQSVVLEIYDAASKLVKRIGPGVEVPCGKAISTDMPNRDGGYGRRRAPQAELITTAGLQRYRWDMSHYGAWNQAEAANCKNGPLVKPGTYTAKLIIGDQTLQTQFELLLDPDVALTNTSLADIAAQEKFALQIVDLHSQARKFQADLEKTQADFVTKKTKSALTAEETAQLAQVETALKQIKTAGGPYPKPMLVDQISYLYGMMTSADQKPGKDAIDRFAELAQQLSQLQSSK